ncbi:hypothetical protein BN946_scf184969.g85 [Trametes cinnabarina]|uniref:Uncharacterized protein n=1 Tax=Pycnoporus cinnabarinus TaxID=5643 RepID=A0A060SYV7_PYCCI|nr:hypothetical protein BN946_scf184969.g85 [Trametes cinnabarina]
MDGYQLTTKYDVRSLILIDRANFRKYNTDCAMPIVKDAADAKLCEELVYPDVLMLAPPVLYGLSLADQQWLEFNVEHVHPLQPNASLRPTAASVSVGQSTNHLDASDDTLPNVKDDDGEEHLRSQPSPSLDEFVDRALMKVKEMANLHLEHVCQKELASITTSLDERLARVNLIVSGAVILIAFFGVSLPSSADSSISLDRTDALHDPEFYHPSPPW